MSYARSENLIYAYSKNYLYHKKSRRYWHRKKEWKIRGSDDFIFIINHITSKFFLCLSAFYHTVHNKYQRYCHRKNGNSAVIGKMEIPRS